MAVPPASLSFADELDERLVATERMRTQDGGAGFFGLIELHGGERNRGGGGGAVGLELQPAPGGLGARGDLLALRSNLVGALRNTRVAGAQRGLEVSLGAAAAVAARQRHVGVHELGAVGIGGGKRLCGGRHPHGKSQ